MVLLCTKKQGNGEHILHTWTKQEDIVTEKVTRTKNSIKITMKDEIVLSKKEIELTTQKAGTFAVSKEGEQYLIMLTEWIDFLNAKLEEAKHQIAEDAISNGEDNILGDTLRIAVRPTGKRFEGHNPAFMKEVSYKRIDEQAVDEYMDREGRTPDGITNVPQEIKASIYVKKNKKT